MFLSVFAVLTILSIAIAGPSSQQSCPSNYMKITPDHTMCQSPNPSCKIYEKGVTEADKDVIVDLHNQFRSKIATGEEKRAGGMPQAADMLEMSWDDELAKIAQRHAESCVFKHDCDNCRDVERYHVGQNIARKSSTGDSKKDWTWFVTNLYEKEVSHFSKRLISPFVNSKDGSDTDYRHFTQIVWSKSDKIGCGWVLFKDGKYKSNYYVCNYGPGGNVKDKQLYIEGNPCSSCPKNTCCGEECKKFNKSPKYKGLCCPQK